MQAFFSDVLSGRFAELYFDNEGESVASGVFLLNGYITAERYARFAGKKEVEDVEVQEGAGVCLGCVGQGFL